MCKNIVIKVLKKIFNGEMGVFDKLPFFCGNSVALSEAKPRDTERPI